MFVQKKRGLSEDDEQDDANELAWLRARSRPFSQPYGLGANGLAGLFLGGIGGAHAVLLVQSLAAPRRNVALVRWCLYACAMCGFHASEFLGAAAWRWRDVSFDSWLLNHSVAYGLAFFAAVLEFALEYRLPLKQSAATLRLGVVLVAGGQAVRLAALATCGEHFAHRVATQKPQHHRLVTTGVYSVLRHPSYCGWFWWSLGTQVLLANPVCLFLYALLSWRFFRDRIPFEEATLGAFYPREYPSYRARTHVGIPFIS